jgi:hypothetical protein
MTRSRYEKEREARIARNNAELQKLGVMQETQMLATALTGLATTAATAATAAEKEEEVEASSTLAAAHNGSRASVAHHKYYGEPEDPAQTKMLHARSNEDDTDLSTEGEKALADGPKPW